MRHGKMNKANTKPRIGKPISAHTRRWRVGSPLIHVRNLVSVGARPVGRSSHWNRNPEFSRKVAPITALPHWLASGLTSMMQSTTKAISNLLPKTKRELKRQHIA